MNKRCTKNIMPLNSIPVVNTNEHNVASSWCLWVAWAIGLVFHFSPNLSYSTIRKKTFVLSRSYRLGYTECFMSYGCDYMRWFPRALRSKMFVSIWALPWWLRCHGRVFFFKFSYTHSCELRLLANRPWTSFAAITEWPVMQT